MCIYVLCVHTSDSVETYLLDDRAPLEARGKGGELIPHNRRGYPCLIDGLCPSYTRGEGASPRTGSVMPLEFLACSPPFTFPNKRMRGHGELLYILILVNIKSVENLHFFYFFYGSQESFIVYICGCFHDYLFIRKPIVGLWYKSRRSFTLNIYPKLVISRDDEASYSFAQPCAGWL